MPDDLLARVREQAERSEPTVRVAALLRIARVESAVDSQRARNTFERALIEARQITGIDGNFLVAHARLIAAAVAPELLPEIASTDGMPRRFESETLGRIMLDHHHESAAFDYLVHYDEPSSFPFGVAAALMRSSLDVGRRLLVLRSSIAAWRETLEEQPFHRLPFISLFRAQWKVLPLEEAAAVARETVLRTLEQPDHPTQAFYDPERTVSITSGREHTLFQIFHIVRHLDAPLTESLIARHEQLAAAVRRFPNGMESVMQEAEARRAEATMETSVRRSSTRWRNIARTPRRKIPIGLRRNSGPRPAVFGACSTKPENRSEEMQPFTSNWFPMTTSGSSHRLNSPRHWPDYPNFPECSASIVTILTARANGCHAPRATRWILVSGARNVDGLRMRRLIGPAGAGIFGIHSTPGARAGLADINGPSPPA